MNKNKYQREIVPGVYVDVYDVLKAFDVTCPAMAHAIKKCLAPGQRGVKDSVQDKSEAIASIKRSVQMESGWWPVDGGDIDGAGPAQGYVVVGGGGGGGGGVWSDYTGIKIEHLQRYEELAKQDGALDQKAAKLVGVLLRGRCSGGYRPNKKQIMAFKDHAEIMAGDERNEEWFSKITNWLEDAAREAPDA